MSFYLRFSLLGAIILVAAGCAHEPANHGPTVYRGGQYYGDALHAKDLPASGRD